jgi:NAD(P)-dependent dehydrogenase (short-subunit alcohol dehydrogenase family)
MRTDLDAKAAIVTGGGSGIGAAIAQRLVKRGARVCLVGRRPEPLDEVIAALPEGSACRCAADVSLEGDVRRVVETALEFGHGRLDIVVNNAAVSPAGSLETMDLADWERTLAANVTGPMLLTREAIPHLRAKRAGAVVNVASVGAFRPVPAEPAYCASKAALVMLTQQAALDYGPDGIRFNVVCPGRIRTPMGDADMERIVGAGGDLDDAYRTVSRHSPLRRVGLPDEIADAVVFLASDDSSFITGAVLVADGGATLVNVSQLSFLANQH